LGEKRAARRAGLVWGAGGGGGGVGSLPGDARNPAVVIAVPVRDDQVVDLREAGVFHRIHDSPGISRSRLTAVAGVDQDRFARWRDEQHRAAAFNIDEVELEAL